MMQMPLLSYPHFSQFLQLQQHQQQLQQHYSRNFLPSVQATNLGMLSHRSGTSCSEASTGTPSPSPSPPLSISENYPSMKSSQKSAKSFTIDAILGIRDREMEKINREHLIPNSFHPRLGLHLSGSRVEIPNNFTDSLDMNSARLELNSRRLDVARLSSASREVLGLQLPTDLSTSSGVPNSGSEITRRDLHHQISTYQSSTSCPRLTGTSTRFLCF